MHNQRTVLPQFREHVLRRSKLVENVTRDVGASKHIIFLSADFEKERGVFRQESSFYYLTGITEPAVAIMIDCVANKTILWVHQHTMIRSQWLPLGSFDEILQDPLCAGIDEIRFFGAPIKGYQVYPFFDKADYQVCIAALHDYQSQGYKICTLYPDSSHGYLDQRLLIDRLALFGCDIRSSIFDISTIVATLRRTKSGYEIELLLKAIEVTVLAHESAAGAIESGVTEAEVQGQLEYIMTASNARIAFPSIVGSGKNSTILHYHSNDRVMQKGDLVVVDIGADLDYYCADLTRTYPVGVRFLGRQQEIYDLVWETQALVAQAACPGMWLNNKEHPEQSLHHIAKNFLKTKGMDEYFIHGIGHFLGIDVHDVGDINQPLRPGDVFTIEPGIYMQKEAIGVRIEDNYWMTEKGAVCLSDMLASDRESIEFLMTQNQMSD